MVVCGLLVAFLTMLVVSGLGMRLAPRFDIFAPHHDGREMPFSFLSWPLMLWDGVLVVLHPRRLGPLRKGVAAAFFGTWFFGGYLAIFLLGYPSIPAHLAVAVLAAVTFGWGLASRVVFLIFKGISPYQTKQGFKR